MPLSNVLPMSMDTCYPCLRSVHSKREREQQQTEVYRTGRHHTATGHPRRCSWAIRPAAIVGEKLGAAMKAFFVTREISPRNGAIKSSPAPNTPPTKVT